MKFDENNVICPKYIDIMHFGGDGGDGGDPPFTFCLLFKQTEKVQEHDLYQILHYFHLEQFLIG